MTTSVSTRSPGSLNPTRQQLDELDALLQRMLELPVSKLADVEPDEIEQSTDQPIPSHPDAEDESADEGSTSAPQAVEEDSSASQPPMRSVSYMVVETASPRSVPPASDFEARRSSLTPRLVPATPTNPDFETPTAPEDAASEASVPSEYRSGETPAAPADDAETWVPLRSTWKPSAQTWPPLADSWHQAIGELPGPTVLPTVLSSPEPEMPPSPAEDHLQPASGFELTPPEEATPLAESERDEPESTPPAAEPQLTLTSEDAPVSVPALLLPLLWFNQGFDACLIPLGPLGRWVSGPRGRQLLGFIGLTSLAAAIAIAVCARMGWTW